MVTVKMGRYKQDEAREAFRRERTRTYVTKKNVAQQSLATYIHISLLKANIDNRPGRTSEAIT